MKIMSMLFCLSIGSLAFGESLVKQETYVCQIEKTDQTLTLMKTQELPAAKDSEIDSKARYILQIQTTELAFPSVSVGGVATTADVDFNFKSDDGRYAVQMYLDDSAGVLTKDGQESTFAECFYF